jgi:hypothetical protein
MLSLTGQAESGGGVFSTNILSLTGQGARKTEGFLPKINPALGEALEGQDL